MIEEFLKSLDDFLREKGYKLKEDKKNYKKYIGNSYLEIHISNEVFPLSIRKEKERLDGGITKMGKTYVFIDNNGNLVYGDEIEESSELYEIVNYVMKKMNST